MKQFRQEHFVFMCFMAALCVGAIVCSSLFADGLVSYQHLYERMRDGWEAAISASSAAIRNTVWMRVLEAAVLIWSLKSRLKTAVIWLIPIGCGVSMAVMMTILTWSRGFTGFFCFWGILLPHGLFYGAAIWLLLLGLGSYHIVRKGKFWCAVLGLISLGLLCELNISPWLLRLFL